MLIGAFYTFGESLAFIAQSVNNDPLPSPPTRARITRDSTRACTLATAVPMLSAYAWQFVLTCAHRCYDARLRTRALARPVLLGVFITWLEDHAGRTDAESYGVGVGLACSLIATSFYQAVVRSRRCCYTACSAMCNPSARSVASSLETAAGRHPHSRLTMLTCMLTWRSL